MNIYIYKSWIGLNFAIALPPFIFLLLLAKYLTILKGIIIFLVIILRIINLVYWAILTIRHIVLIYMVHYEIILLITIFNRKVKSLKLIFPMWVILILLPIDFSLPVAPLLPILYIYYRTVNVGYKYWIREHIVSCMVFFLLMLFMIFIMGPITISHKPINSSISGIILEPLFSYLLEPLLRLLLFILSLIIKPIIKLFKIIYRLWCWIGYSTILGYLKYLMFLGNELNEYFLPLFLSHNNKTKLSPPILPSIIKDPPAFNSGECIITHIKITKKKMGFTGVSWNNKIFSFFRLQKRSYSISSHLSDGNFKDITNKNKSSQTYEIENDSYKTELSKLNLNNFKQITRQIKSFEQDNEIKKKELSKARRYFPSSTKEWYNSQYTYNPWEMRSMIGLYFSVTKLIKTYFSSKPNRKKKQMRGRRLLMTNKLYISKPELKHTSNKVTTILYIFAEKYFNLTYLLRFLNKENFQDFSLLTMNSNNLLKLKNSMNNEANLGKNLNFIRQNKKKMAKLYKLEKQLGKMSHLLENKLSESYKKKQEIKLIRLKYLYLNNYMLSEYIALKLISKKRNLFRAKKYLFGKIKFPYLNKHDKNQFSVARKNIILKSLQNKTRVNRGKIIWNEWRKKEYFRPDLDLPFDIVKVKNSYKDFLNFIKYKFPVGIRLGIAGRLTKRNVASRSLKKFTYIGSIKDIDSSYKNLSVPTLRGYLKTSLDYTKFNSLAQTGAFTVKSWLSKNY